LRDISAFSAVEMHLHDIALYKFSILFYSIISKKQRKYCKKSSFVNLEYINYKLNQSATLLKAQILQD